MGVQRTQLNIVGILLNIFEPSLVSYFSTRQRFGLTQSTAGLEELIAY